MSNFKEQTIEKRTIFIDGSLSGGDYTNFNVNLSTYDPFFKCNENEHLYVSPICFSILNDFYNISDAVGNNQITIKKTLHNNPLVIQSFTVTLDDGYYDIYILQQAIQQAIQTGLTNNIIGFTWSTSVLIDPETSFYTITMNATSFFSTWDLYIEFNTGLAQFLGFEEYAYIKGLSSSNSAFWISTRTPNFLFQNEIFIYSNCATTNFENSESGLVQSQLWFSIPINVPKYALINYIDSSNGKLFEVKSTNQFLTNMSIKLVDFRGEPIYFQNYPNFTITITKKRRIIKQEDKTLEEIKKMFELMLLMNSIKNKEFISPKQSAEIEEKQMETIKEDVGDFSELTAYEYLNI